MGNSIFKILFTLCICLILSGCNNIPNIQYPIAKSGEIDLRNWNFDQYPEINLDGEWRFYWSKLYSFDGLNELDKQNTSDVFIQVPGVWNNKKIDDQVLNSNGYATYRLKILLTKNIQEVGIFLPDNFQPLYSIWINGKKKAWNGILGKFPETTKFDNHKINEYIKFDSSEIDLVIEIANSRGNTRWGGLRYPIYLVTSDQARNNLVKNYLINFFIFSFIFTIGFYNLVLSFQYKSKKKYLYFGIFCIFASLYTLPLSSVWSALFPNIGQDSLFLIRFFLEFSLSPIILAYYYSLFPKDINKFLLFFLTLFWLVFFISLFVIPIHQLNYFYQYTFILPLMIGLYILIKSIKLFLTERVNSDFVFYSNFILFVFFLFNGLGGLFNHFYIYPYSFSTGLFIFILIHTLMNSINIAKSLKTADDYSKLDYRYKQLYNSQSEERSRIARDIHDSIGSELTAILSQSPRNLIDPLEYNIIVRSQLNHLLINIRDIVYLLGKHKTNYEILESEILKYIERLDISKKFLITHNIQTISYLITKDQALNIQRIFLEIMTNTIRHSKSEQIRIDLKVKRNRIMLHVIHDGNYFSWNLNDSPSEGTGLEGIYFRILKLNGKLKAFRRKNKNFLRILLIPGNLISLK